MEKYLYVNINTYNFAEVSHTNKCSLTKGKRGILMPNQFENNESSSKNKYELKQNATSSYSTNEYETEFASENADFTRSNAVTIASGASISKSNSSSSFANEEYASEIAPQIVDFNRTENSTSNSASSQASMNSGQNHSSFANEEYAAEIAPKIIDFNRRDNGSENAVRTMTNSTDTSTREEGMVDNVTSGKGIGGLALALSILSLFVLPIVLGAAGIIIGFIARRRGATTLGAWAIGIGAISIIVGMFVLPFF